MSPAICPHCGFDLKAAAPVTRGRWQIDRTCVRFDGIEVRLPRQAVQVMHALASVAPATIETSVLGDRFSDSDNPFETVRAAVHRIKSATGAHHPIENVFGIGYRWVGDQGD